MISFIISGVVDKELYFLWNQFKMSEDAIIYMCADLLTSLFSTIFLTMKVGLHLVDRFWNLNRCSVSFCIVYSKSLTTNHFLWSQCHPFIYFFYISSDIYIKALQFMYAFEVVGWLFFSTLQAGSSHWKPASKVLDCIWNIALNSENNLWCLFRV